MDLSTLSRKEGSSVKGSCTFILVSLSECSSVPVSKGEIYEITQTGVLD